MPGSQREVQNAEEEGVEFVWLAAPNGFEGDPVTGVKVQKMRLGAPDATGRQAPELIEGSDYVEGADIVIKALGFEPEDLLVDGDKGVARARFTGTHEGDFMGVPASGKPVDVQLIDIFRFGDDGLVREHWGVMDTLALMQQVGAIPDGPPA